MGALAVKQAFHATYCHPRRFFFFHNNLLFFIRTGSRYSFFDLPTADIACDLLSYETKIVGRVLLVLISAENGKEKRWDGNF